ncbi:hypothetical protein C5167_000342 [Papaver somniferum]|uniref:Uncharacterized protein n=1 Tax=Papaver somniferum TaxID=3469 RepID=A0A4Y7KTY5_PAPSO|nr:hypothetical protein C5167_000342 [Papaver somniferum]
MAGKNSTPYQTLSLYCFVRHYSKLYILTSLLYHRHTSRRRLTFFYQIVKLWSEILRQSRYDQHMNLIHEVIKVVVRGQNDSSDDTTSDSGTSTTIFL